MSIFDNLLGGNLKEQEKIRTKEASLDLIKGYLGTDEKLFDLSAHGVFKGGRENMYKFTVKLMSLDFLNKVAKDKRIKNVFFASRHPHPGGGTDSISLRHKIIIEYY